MNKLLITGCLLATAFAAAAMPTKKELAAAQKRVEDVIAPDVKALDAGRKTVKDVADIQMKLAADAQSEAEKYLLLQSAFKLYSRGEEFDSAAKALTAITRDIKDVPPELITELVDKEFNRDMGLKAPKEIEAMVRNAERFAQVKAEKPQREVVRTDLYCVIDISGGPNAEHYPVSYLDAVPEGGWTDEYKTTKIVLRRIDAGTWPMIGNRHVTFTKPFYIGIFELTQKQVKLVSGNGNKKFVFENDMRPADNLTFEEMRGKNEEFDYPKTKEVASESIVGRLRAKTGLAQIDLPTSYQFGCAWNAGTDGAGRDACLTGRHFHNQRDGKGGFNSAHTVVGSYQPNEWGIYDLHGNVWEMCLDYAGKQSQEGEADPEGPENGVKRLCRGGGWHSSDRFVNADYIPQNTEADESHGWSGCRIVINAMPDEIKDAERQANADKRCEAARKEQRQQLREIQEKLKRVKGARESVKESSPAVRQAVESILKGMIKVPGRDYWLSATELTQEQWEPIMGYNLSKHKGENLPVEMVSRDDCDVFLEKLNQTKEVRESQFEFGLPTGGEWLYAAQGGSGMADVCWIKPGVVGNVLDMAWVGENSSNQTHVVATKSANAFGFYDMKGNVWEWLFDPARERGVRRGHSFCEDAEKCSLHNWINTPRNRRYGDCGLRLAAHKRVAPRPLLGGLRRHDSVNNEQASSPRARRLQRQQEAQAAMQLQTTIDDYTWSYHVNNGEAEIVASVGGRTCAISPSPTGKVLIPSTLEGVSVRSIGGGAFFGCSGLKEVIIPPSVTSIGIQAFTGCSALTSVTLHECVTNISEMAFQGCSGLFSVTIPPAVKSLASQTFVHCGNLTVVTIPSSVTSIGDLAFCDCGELTSVTMLGERPSAPNNIFQDCGKLKLIHVPANCKSWAGMKEWQGIPLVFDAK